MATKKKTTTEVKPKTFTLTEKQFETLKAISDKLTDIRQKLHGLEGEENLSTVMFKVGAAHSSADWSEDELNDIISSFNAEEDCDDCDEDDSW